MKAYQKAFIDFAIQQEALLFGEFKLKSGRTSPYFFNSGCFNTGEAISKLGYFYAQAIKDSGLEYDILFGPAYKGIPLVTSVAIALFEHEKTNKPYAFNRKEPKKHGECGSMVGAELRGRVLLIDDVISAGVTINDSADMIKKQGATFSAVCISVDREEKGSGEISAVKEVEQRYALPVINIVGLSDIMIYLHEKGENEKLEKMKAYQAQYGVFSTN